MLSQAFDEKTAAGAAMDVSAEVSRQPASPALIQAAGIIDGMVSERSASRAAALQPEDRWAGTGVLHASRTVDVAKRRFMWPRGLAHCQNEGTTYEIIPVSRQQLHVRPSNYGPAQTWCIDVHEQPAQSIPKIIASLSSHQLTRDGPQALCASLAGVNPLSHCSRAEATNKWIYFLK